MCWLKSGPYLILRVKKDSNTRTYTETNMTCSFCITRSLPTTLCQECGGGVQGHWCSRTRTLVFIEILFCCLGRFHWTDILIFECVSKNENNGGVWGFCATSWFPDASQTLFSSEVKSVGSQGTQGPRCLCDQEVGCSSPNSLG